MVAIELQHENRSDSMFWGICEPQYNGLKRELPVILILAGKILITLRR